MVGLCRSCHARVIWLTIRPGGRRMPIDVDPVPDGNIIADLAQAVGVVVPAGALTFLDDTPDEARYRSHFASCPQAAEWRRS
jgi:hypothetical protein